MTTAAEDYRAKVAAAERFTRVGAGRYRLDVPDAGVTFDLDRLRRESNALWGELTVRCALPGARTYNGILSAGDCNLSSVRARQERAKHLAERALAPEVDFHGLLEELAQRTIAAEREGEPLIVLRDLPRPAPDETRVVDGLPLLARHPMILFGDGGAAKSYLALYLAGRLEQEGVRTAIYDWELSGADHRDRLERIFGAAMPAVRYHRCSAPLIHEVDRIRRDVQTERLEYLIFDSIAFACHDAPENAATAGAYLQAVRSCGEAGSLHLAHITKGEGSDQKPFGSAFWHNGARATWYLKRADDDCANLATIAAYNRKANLGPKRPPIGWTIDFSDEAAAFRRANVADTPELAVAMSMRQRIALALRPGAMTISELAESLEVKPDTIEKTVKRSVGKVFTYVPGPDGTHLVGLLGRAS